MTAFPSPRRLGRRLGALAAPFAWLLVFATLLLLAFVAAPPRLADEPPLFWLGLLAMGMYQQINLILLIAGLAAGPVVASIFARSRMALTSSSRCSPLSWMVWANSLSGPSRVSRRYSA